jgi:hypothetical protein
VHDVERLDLGDTTFKHIDDPIAFTVQLNDGSVYERAEDPYRYRKGRRLCRCWPPPPPTDRQQDVSPLLA